MKIVGDINCFESIEQIKNQKVKLANDELAEHEELKANLISVSKVTANGKPIVFTNKIATIMANEIVISVKHRRDLYIVDAKSKYAVLSPRMKGQAFQAYSKM
ncbi:uncharacterized protein LOC126915303 [Bombus affinis]|uniref:uncharacterized protein LOC126915303 n=1 Tax=Bombus affinis TaxID=309941 RepID=UPI0021B775D3|nr:uncharacterized protein LOC126915303 [Bombus affinis]